MKRQMSNNVIEELRSDKLQLQQRVAHLQKLLQAQKEEKQVQQVKRSTGASFGQCFLMQKHKQTNREKKCRPIEKKPLAYDIIIQVSACKQ